MQHFNIDSNSGLVKTIAHRSCSCNLTLSGQIYFKCRHRCQSFSHRIHQSHRQHHHHRRLRSPTSDRNYCQYSIQTNISCSSVIENEINNNRIGTKRYGYRRQHYSNIILIIILAIILTFQLDSTLSTSKFFFFFFHYQTLPLFRFLSGWFPLKH